VPNATQTGIGVTLRTARETLGTSIEEAAWRTRIRPEYLRALEEERFDAIGHAAVARSHLHSYARFLGLDADAIAKDYRDRFEERSPSPIERLHEQVKESRKPPKPKWLIAAALSSVVLIAASLTGIVRGPGPRTTPSGKAADLPTLPATAQAPSVGPSTAAAAPGAKPVAIVVVATGRSWVRAVADGTLVFEGTMTSGASRTFEGSNQVDITIGNAGNVRLVVNGVDRGAPGKLGDVYRASFGPRGEIKPQ